MGMCQILKNKYKIWCMKGVLINGNVLNFKEYLNTIVFIMQFRVPIFSSAPLSQQPNQNKFNKPNI